MTDKIRLGITSKDHIVQLISALNHLTMVRPIDGSILALVLVMGEIHFPLLRACRSRVSPVKSPLCIIVH